MGHLVVSRAQGEHCLSVDEQSALTWMVAGGGSGNHKPLKEKERHRKPGRNAEGTAPPPRKSGILQANPSSAVAANGPPCHNPDQELKGLSGVIERYRATVRSQVILQNWLSPGLAQASLGER